MEYKTGFKFKALVNYEIVDMYSDGYTAEYCLSLIPEGLERSICKYWVDSEELKELSILSDPEKRKQAQQEKIDKLKQQLVEEQAKLEKM